ncbi:protein of unknown function DUF541 [Thermodesulfobium narugense DSM 14796]|uniref:26 kDa periplasmic immunogenic protein n=1 Tax=Thermodesulfobium narugense DSM 14796 TaxID=747365 RepID=M1E789_9BACT|nr:SIMPL domain-containing protein [Thermodesulfobium narugense]AEE14543.1 protein of unknown function DUF541 [Thermodesulfobium narugense DSM 14796]
MNKIYYSFLVFVSAVCFLIISTIPSFGSENTYDLKINNDKTISVVGTGIIKEKPDIAEIDFEIDLKNIDPSKAMENLAQKANSLLQNLYEQGINRSDVKTLNVILQPIYFYDKNSNKEVLDGYNAREYFILKTSVEDSGKIISLLTNSGVNRINNIKFERSNMNQLKLQAIELAMNDARKQAEAVLSKTMYKISGIKSVTVSPITVPSPMLKEDVYNKSLETVSQNLPVEGGEIEVKASLQVVFIFE